MQKRKVNGEWQIKLTKTERQRLDDACDLLCDLHELDANVGAVAGELQGILSRVSEDGIYTEREEPESSDE